MTVIPCRPGHERCAVDGVECDCEQIEPEKLAEHVRKGPSPTVCRVMAQFCERIGAADDAAAWRKAAEMPSGEGNA